MHPARVAYPYQRFSILCFVLAALVFLLCLFWVTLGTVPAVQIGVLIAFVIFVLLSCSAELHLLYIYLYVNQRFHQGLAGQTVTTATAPLELQPAATSAVVNNFVNSAGSGAPHSVSIDIDNLSQSRPAVTFQGPCAKTLALVCHTSGWSKELHEAAENWERETINHIGCGCCTQGPYSVSTFVKATWKVYTYVFSGLLLSLVASLLKSLSSTPPAVDQTISSSSTGSNAALSSTGAIAL